MLHIERIEIHNFGPFVDEVIDFDDKSGISIIWGENGSGKTTLVEIIKYALYGQYFGEKGRDNSKVKTLSHIARMSGDYCFYVTIDFTYDGNDYSLCRRQEVLKEVKNLKDSDFEESILLKEDGNVLSQSETVRILQRIMPEDISRFFMFDGEMITRYSEILSESNSDEEGRKIKETIEKILGVPALQNSAKTLSFIVDYYDKEFNNAKTEDASQKALQQVSMNNKMKVDQYTKELQQYEEDRDRYRKDLVNLESKMQSASMLHDIITDKRSKEERLEKLKEDIRGHQSELRVISGRVWKQMVSRRCQDAVAHFKAEIKPLSQKVSLSNLVQESLDTGICPICLKPMDSDHLLQLPLVSKEDEARLTKLQRYVEMLEPLTTRDDSCERLSNVESKIMRSEEQAEALAQEIAQLDKRIKQFKVEEDEAENILGDYRQCVDLISKTESAIEGCRKNLEEAQRDYDRSRQKLKEVSSGEMNRIDRRREMCLEILNVLKASIDDYCQSLKTNVERDATKIFQVMAKGGRFENHYLRLTDNYSLKLLFSDDYEVPRRSEGYEKIIALSLLGGIHSNAPIEGPTFIDSPFTKLDKKIKNNVPETFGLMGDQVILLLYEGEIQETDLRNSLGSNLLREYRLVHESEYKTSITEVGL